MSHINQTEIFGLAILACIALYWVLKGTIALDNYRNELRRRKRDYHVTWNCPECDVECEFVGGMGADYHVCPSCKQVIWNPVETRVDGCSWE